MLLNLMKNFFIYGNCGLFLPGILGPGLGPGGISQDLILASALIAILFKEDISSPNLCKIFLQISGIRFLLFSFSSLLSEVFLGNNRI